MRVIVTRPRERAGPLVDALREQGFDVELCPLVELVPVGPERIDVSGYDWVVVTSAFGAEQLALRRSGDLPRVAAVGPATGRALRDHGIEPALVPRVASQEGLLAELPRPAGNVLFVAAAEARDLLTRELGADVCVSYVTRPLLPARRPAGDAVVLAYGSAARAWAALGIELPGISSGAQTSAMIPSPRT